MVKWVGPINQTIQLTIFLG